MEYGFKIDAMRVKIVMYKYTQSSNRKLNLVTWTQGYNSYPFGSCACSIYDISVNARLDSVDNW